MSPRIVHLPKGGGGGTLIETAEPTTLGHRVRPATGTRVATVAPTIGSVRLAAEDQDALSLLCELGDGIPRVTQGYAEWEETDRPSGISLTDWRGYKPIGIELPLWLDDFANGRSVEDAIDILEAFAGRGRRRIGGIHAAYSEPPKLVVHASGVMPYDAQSFPDMRWIVTALDWDDDAAITNDSGNRVRAPVTVTLLQHVAATGLHDRALAARQALTAKSRKSRGRYTVQAGDTVISIARRKLGDPGRYQEILKLNGLRDPRAIRAGAVLRLPG